MRLRESQNGVMLIEALIGILIFSIGILALIGMQGVAMKNTNDAQFRSEAAFLVNEIVGQMWVDTNNLASYDTSVATAYAPRDDWVTEVQTALPNAPAPTITVCPQSNPACAATSNQVSVTVKWQQPGDPQLHQLQVTSRVNSASAP